MPSTQTAPLVLDEKIRELEKKQSLSRGGLSDANARHLAFLGWWREFAGKDVVLVVEPKGVLNLASDVRPAPKIVEAYDSAAADLMAFGGLRNQAVRLATPEEIAAYRNRNEAQTKAANQQIAARALEAAQFQLNSLLGVTPVSGAIQAPPPPVPASAAQGGASGAQEMARRAAAMRPDLGPTPPAVDDEIPLPQTDGTSSVEFLAELATAKQAQALVAAGYLTIEAIAEASPTDLTKAKGVGRRTASKLIVAAAEHLAESEESGEEEGEGDTE